MPNTVIIRGGSRPVKITRASIPSSGASATNLSIANSTSTTLDIASDTGTDATVPVATDSIGGLMSAADKVLLDALPAGAEVLVRDGSVTMTADLKMGSFNIDNAERIGININSPVYGIDVLEQGAGGSARGIVRFTSATNNDVSKRYQIVGRSYTNVDADPTAQILESETATTVLKHGGGDSTFSLAAVTSQEFYAGASVTTTPGTLIVSIDTSGLTVETGALHHKGSTAGFFNAAAVSKPTVTGSRGGNAALASALTALANLGLITDSSS